MADATDIAEVTVTDINVFSWVALATFLIVVVFVIYPVRIPLRICGKPQWGFTLDIATAPTIGILFLLATTSIPPYVVLQGILGSEGIEPWAIMILFFSLAYICISLDLTGVFQYCAFWAANRAGSRGRTAFTAFFLFTTIMSGLTSNDATILTASIFLAYFTQACDIDPTAFLISEFTTANIASMALYIGNPTNVVVAQAYSIGFVEYSAWMMLPTVICIVLAYITMRIMFRKDRYIPAVISSPYEDPRSALNDPAGAIFGSICLGCCLATLIGTSFAGVEVWMITLPFSAVMFARDLWYDLVGDKRLRNAKKNEDDINALQSNVAPSQLDGSYSIPIEHVELDSISGHMTTGSSPTLCLGTAELESDGSTMAGGSQPAQRSEKNTFSKEDDTPRRGVGRFPTIYGVLKRMPWKILPFSVGMFTLVEALSSLGWTAIFSTALVQITPNYIAATFAVTFITTILCQFLNNLPMTILFIRVIQHPNFYQAASVTPVVLKAVLFSLVIGSNLGACLTLVGSLAGIMFDQILKSKDIYVLGYFQFLKWNLIIMPVLATGAACVLIGELWYMYVR